MFADFVKNINTMIKKKIRTKNWKKEFNELREKLVEGWNDFLRGIEQEFKQKGGE